MRCWTIISTSDDSDDACSERKWLTAFDTASELFTSPRAALSASTAEAPSNI